jgi:predicted PurR-regulated permease PerM
MAERDQRMSLHLPWATLIKVMAAAAFAYLWLQIIWVVLILIIAVVIAAGLAPAVVALERRGWPRWIASVVIVVAIVGTIIGFFALSGASLVQQTVNLGDQLTAVQQEIITRAPQPVANFIKKNGTTDASNLAPYALSIVRGLLEAVAAFVLAWILVVYLLIERDVTYQWVRSFLPARHRGRFDRTAAEAYDVAHGFVVGNTITSACAGIYFFTWLTILDVPAALLLALLAFVFDFIPVLGFYLSVVPAMTMAATKSATLALAMIPVYLSYDFIENYLLSPRVYGRRLQISKLAVLLAFAIGGALAGVLGALLALPIAALYPTIEKLWLRPSFGDEVVEAHQKTA